MDQIRTAHSACKTRYSSVTRNYSSFISSKPRIVLGMSLAFMITLSTLPFVLRLEALPDFSDPQKGMRARGTDLNGAHIGFYKRLGKAGFSDIPQNTPWIFDNRHGLVGRMNKTEDFDQDPNPKTGSVGGHDGDVWRCPEGLEGSNFFEMVFEAINGENVLTLESLESMCAFEAELNAFVFDTPPSCEFRALPNHVANFFGIDTCRNITQEHVQKFTDVLVDCHEFYQSGQLARCYSVGCEVSVPEKCSRYDIVFDSLHSLIDSDFSPASPKALLTKLIRVRDLRLKELEAIHYEFLLDRVGGTFGRAVMAIGMAWLNLTWPQHSLCWIWPLPAFP